MTKWTKEPPKEEGWYWRRKWHGPRHYHSSIVEVIEDGWWPVVDGGGKERKYMRVAGAIRPTWENLKDDILNPINEDDFVEWWPIPISLPESEEKST